MKSNFRVIETRVKVSKPEIKESEVSKLFQSHELAFVSYKQAGHVNRPGLKNEE